jgi:hypothetical protein
MSKEPPTPATVDFSKGEYIFGFQGTVVKKAIFERVERVNRSVQALRIEIKEAIGEDAEYFVGLVLALHAPDANAKVLWIASMSKRVLELEASSEELSRIGKGMADSMIYLLSPLEMEKFGL